MTSRSEGLCVFVRVRPPIFKEVKEDTAVHVNGTQSVTLNSESKEIMCSYDHVFNEVAEQSTVFDKVQPLLVDVLSGINSCIFAYGQTSAGKSYTMIGPNGGQDILRCDREEWGILPRASEFLLGYLNEKSKEGMLTYEVKASFLQIYNENLYDLLRDTGPMIEDKLRLNEEKDTELKIREVPKLKSRSNKDNNNACAVNEVFVSGLSEFRVQTSEDILRILAVGTSNRMTRSTDFNSTSSRSHAILQLTFEIESHLESGQTLISRSKLNLVDLAGSEKIPFAHSDMNNNQRHVKELTSINKSLSALGNVIAALASNNRSHIPYRDSKLTRILQDSLSGNTRTILIACIAPTTLHTSESYSTLQFADRAKNVMLTVKANTLVDDKVMLAKAQSEITRLKALLSHALKQLEQKTSLSDSTDYGEEVQRLAAENEALRRENNAIKNGAHGGGGDGGYQNGYRGGSYQNGNRQSNGSLGSQSSQVASTPGGSARKKGYASASPGGNVNSSRISSRRSTRDTREGGQRQQQLLDTKILLDGMQQKERSRSRSRAEKSSYEPFSYFSGPGNQITNEKPPFGQAKPKGSKKKGSGYNTDASDSEQDSASSYRRVRGYGHSKTSNSNGDGSPHQQGVSHQHHQASPDKVQESRVHSKLYKAINDRQIEALNARLASASHLVEEEEEQSARAGAADSINSLLGLPPTHRYIGNGNSNSMGLTGNSNEQSSSLSSSSWRPAPVLQQQSQPPLFQHLQQSTPLPQLTQQQQQQQQYSVQLNNPTYNTQSQPPPLQHPFAQINAPRILIPPLSSTNPTVVASSPAVPQTVTPTIMTTRAQDPTLLPVVAAMASTAGPDAMSQTVEGADQSTEPLSLETSALATDREPYSVQAPPSAQSNLLSDQYNNYRKITTPSMQQQQQQTAAGFQFAPSNRIIVKPKGGGHYGGGSRGSQGGGHLESGQGGGPASLHSASVSVLAAGMMMNSLARQQQQQNRQGAAAESSGNHRAANLSHSKDDIGTPVQMFSFRANSWDRVDIVDYDENRRLHKCQYSDGSTQWLDLNKKPVREYQG